MPEQFLILVEILGHEGPAAQVSADRGKELVPHDRQRGTQVTEHFDMLLGGVPEEGLDLDVALNQEVRAAGEDEVGGLQVAEHDQRRAAAVQVEHVAVDNLRRRQPVVTVASQAVAARNPAALPPCLPSRTDDHTYRGAATDDRNPRTTRLRGTTACGTATAFAGRLWRRRRSRPSRRR
jgi:hypothetical protein